MIVATCEKGLLAYNALPKYYVACSKMNIFVISQDKPP